MHKFGKRLFRFIIIFSREYQYILVIFLRYTFDFDKEKIDIYIYGNYRVFSLQKFYFTLDSNDVM